MAEADLSNARHIIFNVRSRFTQILRFSFVFYDLVALFDCYCKVFRLWTFNAMRRYCMKIYKETTT